VRQITFKVNFLNFRSWSGYGDELAWGAAWLAKATGENYYLKKAKAYFNEYGLCDKNDFSWDNKAAGTKVLLLELTGNKKYKRCAKKFVDYILYQAQYTPKGLIYINQWGTLRHASNMAHACAQV
jgi:endoglucanase